jgi:hypothetical protein
VQVADNPTQQGQQLSLTLLYIQRQEKILLLLLFTYLLTYLLTAIGLSPGGNSPTLVQTKIKIHKTTKQLLQQNNYKASK